MEILGTTGVSNMLSALSSSDDLSLIFFTLFLVLAALAWLYLGRLHERPTRIESSHEDPKSLAWQSVGSQLYQSVIAELDDAQSMVQLGETARELERHASALIAKYRGKHQGLQAQVLLVQSEARAPGLKYEVRRALTAELRRRERKLQVNGWCTEFAVEIRTICMRIDGYARAFSEENAYQIFECIEHLRSRVQFHSSTLKTKTHAFGELLEWAVRRGS